MMRDYKRFLSASQAISHQPIIVVKYMSEGTSFETSFATPLIDEEPSGYNADSPDDVFQYYLDRFCQDIDHDHIEFYRTLWKELVNLENKANDARSVELNENFVRKLKQYKVIQQQDAPAKIGTFDDDYDASASGTEQYMSTEMVLDLLQSIREQLLAELDWSVTGGKTLEELNPEQIKEVEIIDQLKSKLGQVFARKNSEYQSLQPLVEKAQEWSWEPRRVWDIDHGMAGWRNIGSAKLSGTFKSIQCGDMKLERNEKILSVPTCLIVITFYFTPPLGNSIKNARFSVAYDTENDADGNIKACDDFEPKAMSGERNWVTVSNQWSFWPKVNVHNISLELGGLSGTKEFTEQDHCWNLAGGMSKTRNCRRFPNQHIWVLQGNDTSVYPIPSSMTVGMLVEHRNKPFTLEMEIDGTVSGFWGWLHKLLSQATYRTDQFRVNPKQTQLRVQEIDLRDLDLWVREGNRTLLQTKLNREIPESNRKDLLEGRLREVNRKYLEEQLLKNEVEAWNRKYLEELLGKEYS